MQKFKAAELQGDALQVGGIDGKVATITLNRPERKNPLTFESYAELGQLFRKLDPCERRQDRRRHRRRRQFLLRRRRARDHRSAGSDAGGRRHAGPARLHAHDRRARQGDAALPAADHRGGRRHLRRRRRDHRHGLRHADRHAAHQDRIPVRARRTGRRRHGRLLDPAAHHRPGPRLGAALHRPRR